MSKLKAARDQLEQGQERANRLKKSKFEVKTKRKEPDHTLHQSENGSETNGSDQSDVKSATRSIDNLTDRYMDLQDQLDLLIDEYSNAASLKDSINNLGEEIDIWSRKVVHDLNVNLDDSSTLQSTLTNLDQTLTNNWSRLRNFQDQLAKSTLSADTGNATLLNTTLNTTLNETLNFPLEEISEKLQKVTKTKETAAIRLENFSLEKDRLMKYVSDLDLWLKTKEKSLKNIEKTNRAENLKKCKELNVELISQRENVETAKEHLNQLIRQFHSSENIQDLISSVTDLVKSYESVCRYSATVLNKLESNLESNFGSTQEKFFIWKKKQASDVITCCQDVPGESHDIAQNISNLMGLKEDFERVEGWLDELETNFGNQFGGSTNQKMESSISKHRNEYNVIVREVNHFYHVMTEAEAYVKALESS